PRDPGGVPVQQGAHRRGHGGEALRTPEDALARGARAEDGPRLLAMVPGEAGRPVPPHLAEALRAQRADAFARPVGPADDEVGQERGARPFADLRPLDGRDRLAAVLVAEGRDARGELVQELVDLARLAEAVPLPAAPVPPHRAAVAAGQAA